MELELGRHLFDVATRTLVVATVGVEWGRAEMVQLIEQRPAVIQIIDESQLAAVRQIFEGPIAIRTSDAAVAERCFANGASVAHDPAGFRDPAYLTVVEEAGASVIIGCPAGACATDHVSNFLIERARWAEAARIRRPRIVLQTAVHTIDALRDLGYALMLTTTDAEPEAQGLHVLAAMSGIGLIASQHVQATRRTVDTVSELIARRERPLAQPAMAGGGA